MKNTNDNSSSRDLKLPARFERRFSVHLYWVSHGLLLLRSGKSEIDATRVDILFQDVTWMALPAWFNGLEITSTSEVGLPFQLPASIQIEVHLRRVYRLATEGIDHLVVASNRVSISEDEGNYFDASLLIPGLQVTQAFPN